MTTDATEKGLEALIVGHMTTSGWIAGKPADYDRAYSVDLAQLRAFIDASQQPLVEVFELDDDGPARWKFLARLHGEITKRGIIDVLRQGVLVSAVQRGLQRRGGQPAESGWTEDRLPVETHPDAQRLDGHPGERRADRRAEGRQDGPQKTDADLAPAIINWTSSANCWPYLPNKASATGT